MNQQDIAQGENMEIIFMHIILPIIFGTISGTILGLSHVLYEHIQLKKQIKEENSRMIKMYHPKSGYCNVAKSENKIIISMLEHNWTIVGDIK